MIEEYRTRALSAFHDLPVFAFYFSDPAAPELRTAPVNVEDWAWRVGVNHWEGPCADQIFPLFLERVDTTRIRALLTGAWYGEVAGEGIDAFHEALLEAADRFPALEALFLSDIPQDMAEVSWIEQPDPGALVAAFPRLRVLGVRGELSSKMKPLAHEGLEELVLQTGGLPPGAVRALGESSLPALTRLELYLGTKGYNGGATAADLEPILSGSAFPHLRHLGLRDAENADDLAAALAHAPIVARLESLDLSLGALGDEGMSALLAGQPLTHLSRLDLHHHYMSPAMIERVRELLPEVRLDLDEALREERHNGRAYRYVAVAE